jgi:hypothetical protein
MTMTGYTCPHCQAAQLVTEQEQPPVHGCPNCGAAFYLVTNDQGQLQFQWARGPREQQPAPPPAPPQQQAQPQQQQPQHITVDLPKKRAGCAHRTARWLLVIWTVVMLVWFVSGMTAASNVIETADSEAGRVGAEIGTGIGATMICGIWFVGFVVLGIVALVTKPS